jgi:hypothetical protein
MMKTLASLFMLLLAVGGTLSAQQPATGPYRLEVNVGVAGELVGPVTPIQVTITKTAPEALIGRVSLAYHAWWRGSIQDAGQKASIPVIMEEGPGTSTVSLVLPGNLESHRLDVRLEQQTLTGAYTTVATAAESPGGHGRHYSGTMESLTLLVAPIQIQTGQRHTGHPIYQLDVDRVPETWQALFGLSMVIVNDDRLNPAQVRALHDYAAAGGTLVISPTGAASFNPRSLAAVTGASPTQQPVNRILGELVALHEQPSAQLDTGMQAASGASVTIWPDAGEMRRLPRTNDLISHRTWGAGNILLLHVNLSDTPFSLDGTPTAALLSVVDLLEEANPGRESRGPQQMLGDTGLRDRLDIAGRRVPRPEIILITLLAYVVVAGVGVFALARRIKRPELYPGVLIVCAALSMGLVFTIGVVIKRSGPRVNTVRVVVSSPGSGVELHSAFSCQYNVTHEDPEFAHDAGTMFVPAQLSSQRSVVRGIPADVYDYEAELGPDGSTLRLPSLGRWDNVFYTGNSIRETADAQPIVEALDGAWRVTNSSSRELRACLVVVSDTAAGQGEGYLYFYLPRIGPGESLPLRRADAFESLLDGYVRPVRATLDADDFERLLTVLRLPVPHGQVAVALEDFDPWHLARYFERAGLLLPGGSLILATGRGDGNAGLYANGISPNRVRETVIYAIRGAP